MSMMTLFRNARFRAAIVTYGLASFAMFGIYGLVIAVGITGLGLAVSRALAEATPAQWVQLEQMLVAKRTRNGMATLTSTFDDEDTERRFRALSLLAGRNGTPTMRVPVVVAVTGRPRSSRGSPTSRRPAPRWTGRRRA